MDRNSSLALAMAQPQQAGVMGDPFVVIPKDMRVESLAGFVPPARIAQTVRMKDAGSFADYVNRFKDESSVVFVTAAVDGATFKAVLDYHGASPVRPARCEHVVMFQTVKTPNWETWLAINRKPMEQVPFATWIEENAKLFVSPKDSPEIPSGADLLELVKTLEGHSDARFKSAVRLQSGARRLNYEEDITVKGQVSIDSGFVELPKELCAAIEPFYGSPTYEVRARLKFSFNGPKLSFVLETISLPQIIRDNIKLLVQEVAEKTKIVPFMGEV